MAARDEEIFRWTSEPHNLSVEAAKQAHAAFEDVAGVFGFAIADADSGQLLGHLPVTVDHDKADVAYWLAAEARGHGYLNDALRTVLGWLQSLGVHQVTLEVHPENWPSRRAAEKAGFEYSGERRSDKPFADTGRVVVYRTDLTQLPD